MRNRRPEGLGLGRLLVNDDLRMRELYDYQAEAGAVSDRILHSQKIRECGRGTGIDRTLESDA